MHSLKENSHNIV